MPRGIYDRSDQSKWKPNSGRFQKGNHPSLDTEFKKGVPVPSQFKKGEHLYPMPHGHGHFKEPEYIRKQSDTHKGQHSSPDTEIKRGEHFSPDTEFKPLVPGGVSSEDMQIRNSPEYRYWRSAIYKRDDYTCQQCGVRGGRLEAHHVRQFATHPELRMDVDNGITLCKSCHRGGVAICRQVNSQ